MRQQGTQALGLHVGFVETDLTRGLDVVKISPQSVVDAAFDALEAGASEVLADERARAVKQGLTAEPPIYLQRLVPCPGEPRRARCGLEPLETVG